MKGALHYIGSFDECNAVHAYIPRNDTLFFGQHPHDHDTEFDTRFCRVTFNLPEGLTDSFGVVSLSFLIGCFYSLMFALTGLIGGLSVKNQPTNQPTNHHHHTTRAPTRTRTHARTHTYTHTHTHTGYVSHTRAHTHTHTHTHTHWLRFTRNADVNVAITITVLSTQNKNNTDMSSRNRYLWPDHSPQVN